MKGEEYEKRISALGLNQVQSAIMLGVNDRTVRRWIADDVPIPHAVAIVLKLMRKCKIKPDFVRKVAPAPE